MDRRTFLALLGVGTVGGSAVLANGGGNVAAQPVKQISISEDGTIVVENVSDINFGTGVTAADDGDGTVTVTSSGGAGGSHPISDDGTEVVADVGDVDFRAGLSVVDDGDGTVGILIPTDGIVADMIAADQVGLSELDLSISPTWTNAHTWDGAIQEFRRTEPGSGAVIFKRLTAEPSGDEYRWKLTSSGLIRVVLFDANANTERPLWEFDPASQQQNQLATLSFPNITGTPTFASHDHSQTGLAQIPTGGIVDSAITEAKLNAVDAPNSGEFLSWNGTQLEWAAAGGTTVAVEEDGTQLTSAVTVLDFQDRIVASEPVADEIAIDVVQQIAYEPGMVAWPSGLSNVEIWRMALQSGEVLHLERIEFRQKGGGTSTSASIDVFDATAAAQIDSVTLGSTSTAGGTSGSGNIILVRVTNSTDAVINAAPIVRGWIE